MVTLDSQFYDVLRAVMSLPGGSSCTESALAAVTGSRHKEAYLASMIDEGWLEGAVERGPSGNVRAVFVRTISSAGRTALVERLAHSAGQGGLATLSQVARQETGDVIQVDGVELERLKGFGLIATDNPLRLTDLGELLLNAARQSPATNTTIIQGVTNSQVAIGSSRIKGSISIIEQPLERADLIAAVQDLSRRVEELGLEQETEEEILADLGTIRSQLDSPRPKRNIIRACAENIQAVLQSAVGSAVYVGFVEVLKRLMS